MVAESSTGEGGGPRVGSRGSSSPPSSSRALTVTAPLVLVLRVSARGRGLRLRPACLA